MEKRGGIDILYDISEYVTFNQLMDTVGNVNHAVSIYGGCIYDSYYRRALSLIKE